MLFAFAAVVSSPVELGPAWAEFSRQPALRRVVDKVEIGTLGRERSTKRLRYWLRYTRTDNGIETIRWADSATCPAVRPMLEALNRVSLPRPAPPGIGDRTPSEIVIDGVGYFLRVPVMFPDQGGELTMRSNVRTPLAAWVETSFKQLEHCWTDQQPRRNR